MDVFCKIIAGEIKSEIVLEGQDWIAINDIRPKAPVHILVIPKQHVQFEDVESGLAGNLLLAARKVAEKSGIAKSGFRVIINHGEHGGQEVPHLHLHILGGRKL